MLKESPRTVFSYLGTTYGHEIKFEMQSTDICQILGTMLLSTHCSIWAGQITFLHVKHSFSETWGSEDSYHDKSDVYEYHFCVKNMNTKMWKNAGDNVLNQIYQKK